MRILCMFEGILYIKIYIYNFLREIRKKNIKNISRKKCIAISHLSSGKWDRMEKPSMVYPVPYISDSVTAYRIITLTCPCNSLCSPIIF